MPPIVGSDEQLDAEHVRSQNKKMFELGNSSWCWEQQKWELFGKKHDQESTFTQASNWKSGIVLVLVRTHLSQIIARSQESDAPSEGRERFPGEWILCLAARAWRIAKGMHLSEGKQNRCWGILGEGEPWMFTRQKCAEDNPLTDSPRLHRGDVPFLHHGLIFSWHILG